MRGVVVGVVVGVGVGVETETETGDGVFVGTSNAAATYVSQSIIRVSFCLGDGGGFGMSTLSISFDGVGVVVLEQVDNCSGTGTDGV